MDKVGRAHIASDFPAVLAQRQDVQQSGLSGATGPQQRQALAWEGVAARWEQHLRDSGALGLNH